MKNLQVSGIALAGIAMLMLSGCGGGGEGGEERPATTPVSGIVTYAGSPVAGATIKFTPVSGSRSASGQSDEEGKYVMTTFESGDGVIPGDYKISVIKLKQVEDDATAEEDSDDYGGAPNEVVLEDEETIEADNPPENELPDAVADADGSGLTISVGDSAIEDHAIDIPEY